MSSQVVYVILIVAVLLFVGMMVKDWRTSSKKKEEVLPAASPSGKKGIEITLPLCLQAYERLVVLLERIRLQALIHRLYKPGMNVQDSQRLLIRTIRSEYEHNVSQQIYVSTAAWEAVTSAREQLIHHIHVTAAQFSPEEDSNEFRKKLLRLSLEEGDSPVDVALNVLNNESKKLLREAQRS